MSTAPVVGRAPKVRATVLGVTVLLVLCGVALRIRGLFTDFWLDEIWSWNLARQADSPLSVFQIFHDNNHPINTAYVHVASQLSDDWVYFRLLSFVCGIWLIWLLMKAGETPIQRLLLVIFGSLSAMLVVYSSEARGYVPAASLALAAFLAARRGRGLLLTVTATLALLSHLTAAFVYAGLFASSVIPVLHRKAEPRTLLPHVVPAAVALWLFLVFVPSMTVGGGPPSPGWTAVLHAAAAIASWDIGLIYLPAAALVVAVLSYEVALSMRDPTPGFFFAVTLIAPTLALVVSDLNFVTARYFFVCFPFAFLLLARFVERTWDRNRIAGAAIVLVWIIGAGLSNLPFIKEGRGHYLDALQVIAAAPDQQTLASDSDFRTQMALDFYRNHLPAGSSIEYVTAEEHRCRGAFWYVTESRERAPRLPRQIERNGFRYESFQVFPYGTSGFSWGLYRRPARGAMSLEAEPLGSDCR